VFLVDESQGKGWGYYMNRAPPVYWVQAWTITSPNCGSQRVKWMPTHIHTYMLINLERILLRWDTCLNGDVSDHRVMHTWYKYLEGEWRTFHVELCTMVGWIPGVQNMFIFIENKVFVSFNLWKLKQCTSERSTYLIVADRVQPTLVDDFKVVRKCLSVMIGVLT
jgi:hypothetical protein